MILLFPLSFNHPKALTTPGTSFIMSVSPTTGYNIEDKIPVISENLLNQPFYLITKCDIIYSMSKEAAMEEKTFQNRMRELRESTGLNRKEFCEQFDIPYRTVTEWELGHRNAPPYVFRFLEYYIRMQELMKEKGVEKNTR